MAGVADQDDIAPLAGIPLNFHVNLRDQWAGCIKHSEAARFCFCLHRARHTMGREDNRRARRHFLQLLDEYRAEAPQPVNDVGVVHNFVPDIDRTAEQLDRALDDINRPIDSRTESTWVGQKNFHTFALFALRLSRQASNNKNTAPTVMAESATLNAGKELLSQCTRMKSTT